MKILCIAPAAPPLNQAEPIQVYRVLGELLRSDHVDLVSEPIFGSWSRRDDALVLDSDRLRRLDIRMPFHEIAMRVIGNRHLARLAPFTDHWIAAKARAVVRWSPDADLIYTRSFPTRAALLGKALKRYTGKPWVMHLSDPWADNSENLLDGIARARARRDERACFAAADLVALTTAEQVAHAAARYPEFADKFFVTPNLVPTGAARGPTVFCPNGLVELVFAGSLYGRRSIVPLLDAIAALPDGLRDRLRLTVAGNAIPSQVAMIAGAAPNIRYSGLLSYDEAGQLQQSADILVTIEPPRRYPTDGAWLMSKLVEYLAVPKPILAITPPSSVTAKMVDGRYGWSADPADPAAISALLARVLDGTASPSPANFDHQLPASLTPEVAVGELRRRFEDLVA